MKNRTNPMKIFLMILAAALILAAIALTIVIYGQENQSSLLRENVENSFLFGTCEGDVNHVMLDQTLQTMKGLAKYTPLDGRGNANYYQKRLSNQEQALALYNSLLYAADHQFNFISIPAAQYDKETMKRAVAYAFGDLPTVERDVEVGYSDSSVTLDDGTVSSRYYIYLPSGSVAHLSYKIKAQEAAQQIVQSIPASNDTNRKRADYLYDWLVTNVQYTADEYYDNSRPYYLYDTLVGRVTDADGFTKTYALLMNLAGIECLSVFDTVDGVRSGAWNVFQLDGHYYQADPAGDAQLYTLGLGDLRLNFCRSAQGLGKSGYEDIIEAVTPACEDTKFDLVGIDAYVKGLEDSNKNDAGIVAAREKLDGGAAYVAVKCEAFDFYDWSLNFKVISKWFADSKVDFKTAGSGSRICIIYPK